MAISLFGMSTSLLSLTFLTILLGIGFSFVPVAIFSLLTDIVSPEHNGIGLAILTSACNIGISVGPLGLGLILDLYSGDFNIGFIVLSILSIIGIAVLFLIKPKN